MPRFLRNVRNVLVEDAYVSRFSGAVNRPVLSALTATLSSFSAALHSLSVTLNLLTDTSLSLSK